MPGLVDRSHRPHHSPTRIAADVEALVCEMRRRHPRWGARRISHELARTGVAVAPSRASVHRILVRNGLVATQVQEHKRGYRRWQRAEPMHLWQLDIVGGVPLADGRSCKLLTGIDDHSRFIVVAAVLVVPSGRAVCEAFTAAMRRYGVPSEVLTDNGKQFTGRHTRPQPVEVLFERICRENGITARLTKPRSPTTTGKIERFHKTLRTEFLDHVAPFESAAAAQAAIDGWVRGYNEHRPHQALEMTTPASLFRPNGPSRLDLATQTAADSDGLEVTLRPDPPAETGPAVREPSWLQDREGAAVEFEARVPPAGEVTVVSGRQSVAVHHGLAGRTLTVWADQRTVHLLLDGEVLRTVASRLRPEDLQRLSMRGARPAGPPPARGALRRRRNGTPAPLEPGAAVEVDRTVTKDGRITLAGITHLIGFAYAGRRVTLRLDGHLMHAVIDNALAGTWPCPIATTRLTALQGARPAATALPPPPLPAGSLQAMRRVHASGRIMVTGQRIKLGPRHAGKLVTVVIEDTYLRVLHNGEELAVRPRRSLTPITRLHVTGAGVRITADRQASAEDDQSSVT
jgi:transposase InsO family protein